MNNALFAFDDPAAARAALQRLIDAGVPTHALELHGSAPGPHERGLENADEVVTGGLLHNLVDLFRGTFEWGDSPHDAAAYAETIRREGAVISVDAGHDGIERDVDRVMDAARPARRTAWIAKPQRDEDQPRPGEVPRRV